MFPFKHFAVFDTLLVSETHELSSFNTIIKTIKIPGTIKKLNYPHMGEMDNAKVY